MSNALFFISKPLELLGAIEAKTQFDIKNAVLVYSCKKNKDRATIEFLLKKEKIWNTVIFVKPKPYYGLFWVRLIKKLQKEKYTYLFTRAFSTSAYFIHNLEFEKHMLLDDGTATIKIHKEFLKNKNLNKRFSLFGGLNKSGLKYDAIEFIYKLFKIKTDGEVNSVNFFTFFEINTTKNISVYPNKMEWIKQLQTSESLASEQDLVYVIGTNVINAKIVAQSDYLTTLLMIKQYYSPKKIIYIPHVMESEEFLNDLCKNGIEIKHNKYNIELDFLLNGIAPRHIAGTISTSLISLKMIYGEPLNVDFFHFDKRKLNSKSNAIVKEIYEYQNQELNYVPLNYK